MPANAFSHYPRGFTHGVTLRGASVLNMHYGNIFWVDSGHANASIGAGQAGTIDRPFSTLAYVLASANNRLTANNGDIVMVAPGHTETISAAAGILADVAGTSIIGLGNGRERPTISFTATASDWDFTAANIYLENFFFDMTGIDAVVAGIDPAAADITIAFCEFLMSI